MNKALFNLNNPIFEIKGHNSAPSILDGVGDYTKTLGQSIGDGLSNVLGGVSGIVTNPFESIGQALDNGSLQTFGNICSGTGQTIGHSLNNTGTFFNNTAIQSSELLTNALKNTGKVADSIVDGVGSFLKNGTNSTIPLADFANFTSDLIKEASNDTGLLFGGVLSSLGKVVGDVVSDVGSVISKAVGQTTPKPT